MSAIKDLDVTHTAATRRVLADLKKMSRDEVKDTFVRSGIVTPDGELAPAYKPPAAKPPRARRSKR